MMPDTHHLHGEDGGCHRSAEQRGKRSAHTAHDHDVFVLLIKMKQTSQTVSNTAAELQGSTLTAGRTAEQVGDQRRDKNERRHAQRQFIAGMDGGEYKVCAGIALIVKQAVGTLTMRIPPTGSRKISHGFFVRTSVTRAMHR